MKIKSLSAPIWGLIARREVPLFSSTKRQFEVDHHVSKRGIAYRIKTQYFYNTWLI